MTLTTDLARARSEEDVKDAYIKAFGLKPKDYFKGLVDIQTDAVWFEAKGSPTAPLIMFAQLLVYIRGARLRGAPVPAFLAVIDPQKGAILQTEVALKALDDEGIVWPLSCPRNPCRRRCTTERSFFAPFLLLRELRVK